MTRFNTIAAASEGAGFQYYDIQDFSFFKAGGIFLPKFTGTIHETSQTYDLPKNRHNIALTPNIMTSLLLHVDKNGLDQSFGTDEYKVVQGSFGDTVEIGTSGGFPIFYSYNINVHTEGDNLVFTLTISNGSGVNDVTTQDITFNGKVFFYLAPF